MLVQVVGASLIVDCSISSHNILVGRPILGNIQRYLRCFLVRHREYVNKAVWMNFPAHLRLRSVRFNELNRLAPPENPPFSYHLIASHGVAAVIVNPEKIYRGCYSVKVSRCGGRCKPVNLVEIRNDIRRIGALEERVEKEAIAQSINSARSIPICLTVARGIDRVQVECDSDAGLRSGTANSRNRQPMPQQQVVSGVSRLSCDLPAGCMYPAGIPQEGRAPRLVESDPVGDNITKFFRNNRRVVGKSIRGFPFQPSAFVFQGLRQIPVVKRDPRCYRVCEKLFGKITIEPESRAIARPSAIRLDSWPGDGESISIYSQAGSQRNIFADAMVVIIGNLTIISPQDPSRFAGKGIPNTGAASAFRHSTFYLVCSRCSSPYKRVTEV